MRQISVLVLIAALTCGTAEAVMNGKGQDIFPVSSTFQSSVTIAGPLGLGVAYGISATTLTLAGGIVGVSTMSVSSITTTAAGVTFSTNIFVTGRVGIGTAAPGAPLDVNGAKTSGLIFYADNISAAAFGDSVTTITNFFTTYPPVGEIIIVKYGLQGQSRGLVRYSYSSDTNTLSAAYGSVASENGGGGGGITAAVNGNDLDITVDWTAGPSAYSGGTIGVYLNAYGNQ